MEWLGSRDIDGKARLSEREVSESNPAEKPQS
jgi:hypothetical protein